MCLFYGFFIEPKRLVLRQHNIGLEGWTSAPLRAVVISDIHLGGPHMGLERVNKIITQINELDADVVLIAGDFINGHDRRRDKSLSFNQDVDRGMKALGGLNSRRGVYAVIGNHDVWYDAAYVHAALRAVNIHVLANQAVMINEDLCITGLADHETQQEDRAAFNGCEQGSDIIALMHSPDSFTYLRSDVDFAAAGHTHGGQINIPFLGALSTITDIGPNYKQGLKRYKNFDVYISAGLGTSVLPARFRAPPEITLVNIASK